MSARRLSGRLKVTVGAMLVIVTALAGALFWEKSRVDKQPHVRAFNFDGPAFVEGGTVAGNIGKMYIVGHAFSEALAADPNATPLVMINPIAWPGDACDFPSGRSVVLVGTNVDEGLDSYRGVLYSYGEDATGVFKQVGTPFERSESSFVGVTYSQTLGELFVLDATRGEILRAPFRAGQVPPATFSLLAEASDFPALGGLAQYELELESDGPEPVLSIEPHREADEIVAPLRYTVTVKASGPVFAIIGR